MYTDWDDICICKIFLLLFERYVYLVKASSNEADGKMFVVLFISDKLMEKIESFWIYMQKNKK